MVPNQTPPLVVPKIPSIKISNTSGDEGHPRLCPTCDGNRTNLLPWFQSDLIKMPAFTDTRQ